MAGIECDSSAFPFVHVRFAPDNASDAEVRAFIDEQRRLLERKQRFAMLVDASRLTSSSAAQRRMYADWMRESEAPSKLYCLGMAVVMSSPIIRGAMQAVLWLFSPPVPIEVFARSDEARARIDEWLRAAGLGGTPTTARRAS